MLQRLKLLVMRALLWLFEGNTCVHCVYLWVYVCMWSTVVLVEDTPPNPAGAILEQIQIGWHVHWSWCAGLALLSTLQVVLCFIRHQLVLLRLIVSMLTAGGVVYTIMVPILNTYLVYEVFPIASVGSFMVAIVAILIVARNMREAADARR